MSTRSNDRWSKAVASILDDDRIARLRAIADEVSPILVEHWHYYGSRAPTRLVFDDGDAFEAYVREHGRPGDDFWIWQLDRCCTAENRVDRGKMPDEHGNTPEGGFY